MWLFINILSVSLSWAAIPKTKTIFDRLAKSQGSGVYSIELDVQIPVGADVVRIKEIWWIQNGDALKVTAQRENNGSNETFFSAIYKDKQAQRAGLNLPTTGTVGFEFFEPIFHQRSGLQLAKLLMSKKAVPPSVLAEKRVTNLKTHKYEPEPFIKYTKMGSQFYLGLGPFSRDNVDIRVWMEPSRYFFRKINLDGKSEILAENYEQHPRNLWFPKERWVNYDSKSIVLKTQSVRARSEAPDLSPATLTSLKIGDLRLPEEIREFYSRFR